MQTRTESKSKLLPYCSVKQYESGKEHSKKTLKTAAVKSSRKLKTVKSNNHSNSKSKIVIKKAKNNQNFNSNNLQPQDLARVKSSEHELDILKKEIRRDDRTHRNSHEKLGKSKSMHKLNIKTERNRLSPSPLPVKDVHPNCEEKYKTSRNVTSRTEREKKSMHRTKQEMPHPKKCKSKLQILSKKQYDMADRNIRNRQSIKTQMSSKMHSVIKDQQKMKKKEGSKIITKPKKESDKHSASNSIKIQHTQRQKKMKMQSVVQRSILYSQVSFQQYNNNQFPYESAIMHNHERFFLPYPNPKAVKTQGCQMQSKQQQKLSIDLELQTRAAIKIQSAFRGFIIRKYINEAKYIISKTKIIQNWWRTVMKKKMQKNKPNPVSVENSLITIKDFNEAAQNLSHPGKDFNDTFKTDRHKLSESKEFTLSNNKLNMKELIRNILEQDDEDSCSARAPLTPNNNQISFDHDSLASADKSVNKQIYIQHKIQDQIKSEKVFNSPRHNSPTGIITPTNCGFTIKQFFNNSNEKQKIKELMHSPRLASPPHIIATLPTRSHEHGFVSAVEQSVLAFQTNFSAIEDILLLLVNFFRDRQEEMNNFIMRVKQLPYFRSKLILNFWNSFKIDQQCQISNDTLTPDSQYLQSFQKPCIFSQTLRDEILQFPQIQIDLNSKCYALDKQHSRVAHRCFLDFIFDVMEQAFYQPYKSCILRYGRPMITNFPQSNQGLFQHIFSEALGHIFNWGEVMCGMLNLPPQQQALGEMRMKQFQKRVATWDMGEINIMGMKLQMGEQLLMLLIQQCVEQLPL